MSKKRQDKDSHQDQRSPAKKLSRRELLGASAALSAAAGVAMLPVAASGCLPDTPDAATGGSAEALCSEEPLAEMLGVTPVMAELTLSKQAKNAPFSGAAPGLTQLRDAMLRKGAFSGVPALAQELLTTVPPAGVVVPGVARAVESLGWGEVEIANGQVLGGAQGCLVFEMDLLGTGCETLHCDSNTCSSLVCGVHTCDSHNCTVLDCNDFTTAIEIANIELVNNLNHPFVTEFLAFTGVTDLQELASEIFTYVCSGAVDTSVMP